MSREKWISERGRAKRRVERGWGGERAKERGGKERKTERSRKGGGKGADRERERSGEGGGKDKRRRKETRDRGGEARGNGRARVNKDGPDWRGARIETRREEKPKRGERRATDTSAGGRDEGRMERRAGVGARAAQAVSVAPRRRERRREEAIGRMEDSSGFSTVRREGGKEGESGECGGTREGGRRAGSEEGQERERGGEVSLARFWRLPVARSRRGQQPMRSCPRFPPRMQSRETGPRNPALQRGAMRGDSRRRAESMGTRQKEIEAQRGARPTARRGGYGGE